jgi:hypothetical protein
MKSRSTRPLIAVASGFVLTAACATSAPSAGPADGSSSGGAVAPTGSSSGGGGIVTPAGSSSGAASSSGAGSSSGSSSSGGAAQPDGGGPAGSNDAGGSSEWGDGGLGGTTNSYGTIENSPAIPKLLALLKTCTAANAISSDPGDFVMDNGTIVHVCSLPGGPGNTGGIVYFTADMDIDCDGIQTPNCPGTGANMDPSWDNATSFAGPNSKLNAMGQPALASEYDPYVVIPEEVVYPGLDQTNGGNIVAVLYNNQLEFAVFGDQIAAEPGEKGEDIGEASVRTANGLGIPSSPATGGVGGGVTYIVFVGPGTQPQDMENIPEVQALGTKLTEALLNNNP